MHKERIYKQMNPEPIDSEPIEEEEDVVDTPEKVPTVSQAILDMLDDLREPVPWAQPPKEKYDKYESAGEPDYDV